jgi:multidrug efflux pump subunit AcrA (membrane-fusion protein)
VANTDHRTRRVRTAPSVEGERKMRVISGEIGTRVRFACVAAVVVLAAACSSPKSSASGGPKPGPNLITADEIARVNVQNAYEAVQKLRPAMLRQRQIASADGQGGVRNGRTASGTAVAAGEVLVYMDNTRLGDVEQLRQISVASISAVRYFSASEAQTKWGSGHAGGVIEVLTRR